MTAVLPPLKNVFVPTIPIVPEHKTEVKTTQAKKPDSVLLEVVPNDLNKYANYTYHIKWFMMSDVDTNTANINNIDNFEKFIIAESGITAKFSIIDCELTNTCGPRLDTQNMPFSGLKLTVHEAYSNNFYDYFFAAANYLGIKNYLRMSTFIEIYFLAYDQDGKKISQKLNRKFYKVISSSTSTTASAAGATHTFNFVESDQIGFSNQYCVIQGQCTVKANTVGEFFEALGTKLTAQQIAIQKPSRQGTSTTTHLITYKFVAAPGTENWKLQDPNLALKSNQRSSDVSVSTVGAKLQFQIAAGQDIGSVVTYVMSLPKEGVAAVSGSAADYNVKSNGMSKFFMVQPKVVDVGYDTVANDYVREVTFYIIPHIVSSNVIPGIATKSEITKKSTQKAKLLKANQLGLAVKEYGYIYTGENTDVLDFNIQIDNFWQYLISTSANPGSYDEFTVGPQLGTKTVGYAAIKNNSSQSSNNIAASQSTKPNSLSSESGIKNNHAINPSAGQNAANAASSYESLTPSLSSNIEMAIESLDLSNETSGRWPISMAVGPQPLPVYVNQNAPASRSEVVSAGEISQGRGLFGVVAANLYGQNGFFSKIDLSIRGDPFWLALSNFEIYDYLTTGSPIKNASFSDLVFGQNLFYLHFKNGVDPSQETGFMNLQKSSTFSGMYGVYNVVSTFSAGQFTQVLSAYKDILSSDVEISTTIKKDKTPSIAKKIESKAKKHESLWDKIKNDATKGFDDVKKDITSGISDVEKFVSKGVSTVEGEVSSGISTVEGDVSSGISSVEKLL